MASTNEIAFSLTATASHVARHVDLVFKYTTHEAAMVKAKGFVNTTIKSNEIAVSDLLDDVVYGAFDNGEADGQLDELDNAETEDVDDAADKVALKDSGATAAAADTATGSDAAADACADEMVRLLQRSAQRVDSRVTFKPILAQPSPLNRLSSRAHWSATTVCEARSRATSHSNTARGGGVHA